jgi:hypothetical protein
MVILDLIPVPKHMELWQYENENSEPSPKSQYILKHKYALSYGSPRTDGDQLAPTK